MKKLFFVVILTSVCFASFSQSEKYVAAMKSNIAEMDTSFSNPASLLSMANKFERIAISEKNLWVPYYYAAYCQVNFGFMQTDKTKMDAIADKASELIAKADSMAPKNSEISCVKSMIASCHMMVDPRARYMEYGQESSSNMEDAMEFDPSNPRPYLLKGQTLKYMPEQFGGGCTPAKVELQKALDKYSSFKPATELSPVWGIQRVMQLIKECNQ